MQGHVYTESKDGRAPDSKRKKNLSSSEAQAPLQEVNSKTSFIFSTVSCGYKIIHAYTHIEKDAWDAITSLVNGAQLMK